MGQLILQLLHREGWQIRHVRDRYLMEEGIAVCDIGIDAGCVGTELTAAAGPA